MPVKIEHNGCQVMIAEVKSPQSIKKAKQLKDSQTTAISPLALIEEIDT